MSVHQMGLFSHKGYCLFTIKIMQKTTKLKKKKIRTVIQPPTISVRRAPNYKMGQKVNVRVAKLLRYIRRKKIQCKKHGLRIAKTALLCLKAESPSQFNLRKHHEFSDFRKSN